MRHWFKIIPVLLVLATVLCAPSAHADPLGELRFITENYAPYNYSENGRIQGAAVHLLMEMFDELGTEQGRGDIEVMNWARGYQLAQDIENTVLFSMTRTAMREDMFQWVGPIAPTRIVILGKKKNDFQIGSKEELKNYRIGAVRDDIGELLILNSGVDASTIYRTNSSGNTAQMLAADRIDLWAYEESVALFNLREQGEDPEDYEVVMELEVAELYFAIQRDTDTAVVELLQSALNAVVAQSSGQ